MTSGTIDQTHIYLLRFLFLPELFIIRILSLMI